MPRAPRERPLRGLYVIIDPQAIEGRDPLAVAEGALRGGAAVLQLRDKVHLKGEQLAIAREIGRLCREAGALFIVNDHVDLALAAKADGVHLGRKDLPVAAARAIAPDIIIGASTNNVAEGREAQAAGADYVAVGSIFPMASKADIRPASLKVLRQVKGAVAIPVCAIGGINEGNIGLVVAAGADMAAVISAVAGAPEVEAAARRLKEKMEACKLFQQE